MRNGRVRFHYKDYADDQQTKVLPLSSSEFIRRFLLHTLPSGFMRIRYYGFLANRYRQQRLKQCRSLLGVPSHTTPPLQGPQESSESLDSPPTHHTCPVCKNGKLVIIDIVVGPQSPRRPFFLIHRPVTSLRLGTSPRSPPDS